MASARTDGTGLCLLALDGGDIRGISSLLILDRLMEAINPDDPPKPCDYFDMIGGTSTGGLIAVMLGRLRMSVQEAYNEYIKLPPEIFSKLGHRVNWKGQIQGRYDAEAIERGVMDILRKRGLDKDELLKDTSPQCCKTFVCATSKETGQTVILSSHHSRRRGANMRNKVKLWEAVRATSAASSFFDPITIDGLEFVDGATGANNPLDELWTEATDTYKKGDKWTLDQNIQCLVSIGTGRPSFTPFDDSLKGIVGTLTAIATDSEKTWENFNRRHTDMVRDRRLFRFNVDRGLESTDLDEVKNIATIRSATEHYLQTEKIVGDLTSCSENLAEREISRIVQVPVRRPVASWQSKIDTTDTDPASFEKLCQNFSNTFAFDSWIEGSSSWILHYDSNNSSPAFGVDQDVVGAALAQHLSKIGKDIGEVLYTLCPVQGSAHATRRKLLPSHSKSPLVMTLRDVVAQLLDSDVLRDRAKWASPDDEALRLWSTIPEMPVSGLLQVITSLTSHFDLATIIVLSIDHFSIGPNIERSFIDSLRDGHNGLGTWRLLLESSRRPRACLSIDENTEHNDCLESLAFDEIDFYLERIPDGWPGTNTWLWTDSTFRAWRQGNSGMLWIQGKPGSGKSVLARTIVERGRSMQLLDRESQSLPRDRLWIEAHRWIYSRRFEGIYTNHVYMLRSLLFQLLQHNKRMFTHIQAFWRANRKAISRRKYQLNELQQMLNDIVVGVDRTLLFVIDGFDEGAIAPTRQADSQHNGRKEILNFLVDLLGRSRFLKFILLSRPERDIADILEPHPKCHTIVLQHENDVDIRILIDSQLKLLQPMLERGNLATGAPPATTQASGTGKQSTKVVNLIRKGRIYMAGSTTPRPELGRNPIDRIREHLATHAQGVFLWVDLMFKELRDLATQGLVSWNDIETVIKGLPTDLIEMYRAIVEDLESRHSSRGIAKAQKALEWVLVASTRNDGLSLQILRDALSIPHNSTLSTPKADPFEAFRTLERDWSSYRRPLYQNCGPFIDVVRPQGEDPESFGPFDSVQLIHTTAKDFLATQEAGQLQYSIGDSQRHIEQDIGLYLRLSLPTWINDYCPFPVRPGSYWEANVARVLEYLEDKPLIGFALKIFPSSNQSLPYWIDEIGLAVLPPEVLLGLRNQNKQALSDQTKQLKNYFQAFYSRGPLAEHNDPIELSRQIDSAVRGKFFCDDCVQGLSTAVTNVVALTPSNHYKRRDSPNFEILNGALIAAIVIHKQKYILPLTADNEYAPYIPQREQQINSPRLSLYSRLIRAFVPGRKVVSFPTRPQFVELAVQYGTHQAFITLYERAQAAKDEEILRRYPDLVTPVGGGLTRDWFQEQSKSGGGPASDVLHMLKQKPFRGGSDDDAIDRAFQFVLSKYTLRNRDRWRRAMLMARALNAFRSVLGQS